MKDMLDETIEAIDTFVTTRQDVRLEVRQLENMLDEDSE
jgi:hypothetical protein